MGYSILVEESEEIGNSQDQKKEAKAENLDTTIKSSPSKEIQNGLEATPTLIRSHR